jgi:hypothetical protein
MTINQSVAQREYRQKNSTVKSIEDVREAGASTSIAS